MMLNRRRLPWALSPLATSSIAAVFTLALGTAVAATAATNDDGQNYTRDVQSYQIPEVTLRDRRDQPVALRPLLNGDEPIVLQFIFTSCETVCPTLTAMTAMAQEDLRAQDEDTRIVSISIDPNHDTPERMAAYAERFGAKGDWRFLTGSWEDIRTVLDAFNAMYEGGNKMYHQPFTFMRDAGKGSEWVRLNGLLGAELMAAEYSNAIQ